jgi:hypothetical protein
VPWLRRLVIGLSLWRLGFDTGSVKIYIKFTLEQGMKALGVELQLYSFFNLGDRWEWVFKTTTRPLYLRERLGTHCIGGWVGPKAGLDRCGKFGPTGIRSPDRSARREFLYSLHYPGTHWVSACGIYGG